MATPIQNPIFPFNRIARLFFEQTMNQLEVNAMTQRIYPKEIYNGFYIVNEKRKQMAKAAEARGKKGPWYSTGQGVHSFGGRIIEAGENGQVTMAFTFNEYLRFAEMGVGKGTSYEDVETSKKARYQSRYISKWDRKAGRSHRPAIMMELRHLQRRIAEYLTDFYGEEGRVLLVNTFEEASPFRIL